AVPPPRHPEELFRVAVSDELHEPMRVANGSRAGDLRQRYGLAPAAMACRHRLLLGQTDDAHRRIDEDGARDDTVIYPLLRLARERIVGSDAAVLAPDRRSHLASGGLTDDVACGKDAGHVGTQGLVNDDLALLPQRDAHLFSMDGVGGGTPA